MIIAIYTEKASDKFQHRFMIKKNQHTRNRRRFHHFIRLLNLGISLTKDYKVVWY